MRIPKKAFLFFLFFSVLLFFCPSVTELSAAAPQEPEHTREEITYLPIRELGDNNSISPVFNRVYDGQDVALSNVDAVVIWCSTDRGKHWYDITALHNTVVTPGGFTVWGLTTDILANQLYLQAEVTGDDDLEEYEPYSYILTATLFPEEDFFLCRTLIGGHRGGGSREPNPDRQLLETIFGDQLSVREEAPPEETPGASPLPDPESGTQTGPGMESGQEDSSGALQVPGQGASQPGSGADGSPARESASKQPGQDTTSGLANGLHAAAAGTDVYGSDSPDAQGAGGNQSRESGFNASSAGAAGQSSQNKAPSGQKDEETSGSAAGGLWGERSGLFLGIAALAAGSVLGVCLCLGSQRPHSRLKEAFRLRRGARPFRCRLITRGLWPLLVALLLGASVFTLQYVCDNKYHVKGPQGSGGVLDLSGREGKLLTVLARGWEVWPQKLYTPEQLETDVGPGEEIYLGQYGGFEFESPGGNPHGCATYRLRILLPREESAYMLELPEIYSACKVWVNQQLSYVSGDVGTDSYRPHIRTGSVTFWAAGQAEIVVQAADWSHYYSGMVYPPAFGAPDQVQGLLSLRQAIHIGLCAAALFIGLLYLLIALRRKELRLMLFFALYSLCFAGYVSHPLWHTFGAGLWSYALEDGCFYGMLLFLTLMHHKLCGIRGRKACILPAVCTAVLAASLTVPVFLLRDSLRGMMIYSGILNLYKLTLMGCLLVSGLLGRKSGRAGGAEYSSDGEPGLTDGEAHEAEAFGTSSTALMAGLLIFAEALFFQTAFPLFEPLRTGWQTEIAGAVLIFLLAGVLWQETVRIYIREAAYREQVQYMGQQLALEKQNYRLISENFDSMKKIRHDMRHHFRILNEYLDSKDFDNLKHYLKSYEAGTAPEIQVSLCPHPAANAVLQYYKKQARKAEIPLKLTAALPESLSVEDWEIGVLFGNLLENALEASLKLPAARRCVEFHARLERQMLLIKVTNTCAAKGANVPGTGLRSVEGIIRRYQGRMNYGKEGEHFQVSAAIPLWDA